MKKAKVIHTQKLRFIIDVEVSVLDLPQSLIDGVEKHPNHTQWRTENPEDYREYMEFQKRILYATLANQNVASHLIVEMAGSEVADNLSREYTSDHEPSLEKVLSPVINKLSEKDKENIESAIDNGVLFENTETALFESFKAEIIKTSIESL